VADEVGGTGRPTLALACDLADAAGLAPAVGRARDQLGPLRVLVNAAGTDAPGPVAELSVEAWDRVLAVNLRAVFLVCRLAVPDMISAGQGTIINVSSVAGKRGWANASAYCASKFALTGFTQALGAEVRPHGVRACVVYPGAMATHWGYVVRRRANCGACAEQSARKLAAGDNRGVHRLACDSATGVGVGRGDRHAASRAGISVALRSSAPASARRGARTCAAALSQNGHR
jgi:NAD(P)-dependent dehydrogenase (short-subunit alcohol dehydrogenase family)